MRNSVHTFSTAQAVPARRSKLMARVALTALVALGIAGCQQQRLITGSTLHDGYRSTHPIQIDELPKVLDIPVGTRATHLSHQLSGMVRQFAHEARAAGAQEMTIMVPSGSRNEAAAHAVAYSAQSAIASAGYPRASIHIRPFGVDIPHAIAPVRLIYYTVGARVEDCGLWQSDLSKESHPNGYSEFGCATQSNIASMVSNPADLIYPRTMSPPDATRRVDVFEKYQAGQNTATEYETDATVTTDN